MTEVWHHRLNGLEFEQALGMPCCSPWGRKESDTTKRLNNNICYLFGLLPIDIGFLISLVAQ